MCQELEFRAKNHSRVLLSALTQTEVPGISLWTFSKLFISLRVLGGFLEDETKIVPPKTTERPSVSVCSEEVLIIAVRDVFTVYCSW